MAFTSPPPRKHDFSHILPSCLLFIAESHKYHPVVVLLHNDKWLKKISTTFRQVLKQCSVLLLRYCMSFDISSLNMPPLQCLAVSLPDNNNLLTESEGSTGKYQTEDLLY
jgi:hypothetical protein